MTISEKFENAGLYISVEKLGTSTTIRWSGVSDVREPAIQLTPFFLGLLRSIGEKPTVVDFRELEYMNSATVSPIINFVKTLDARGTQTTLLFNPEVPWQKINAQCMRAIARTLKKVHVPLPGRPATTAALRSGCTEMTPPEMRAVVLREPGAAASEGELDGSC